MEALVTGYEVDEYGSSYFFEVIDGWNLVVLC